MNLNVKYFDLFNLICGNKTLTQCVQLFLQLTSSVLCRTHIIIKLHHY